MASQREISVLLSAKDDVSAKLKGVQGKFGDLERAAGTLLRALGPLAGALAVREIIDTAVGWDRYRVALETVTGSQQAANRELDWLRQVADDLGLELETVAGSYTQLAAASKGTSLEGQATRDIFEAVAGAMAKLGKTSADTDGALIAVGQMMSKGKVSAEELRQQLGERMPGAFQLFAKAAGVSTAELDKMLQQGKVGLDILPKFAEEVSKSFDLIDGSRIDTAQAAMNRFNNSLLDLKLTIADAGLLDAFVGGLQAVQSAISDAGLLTELSLLGEMFGSITEDGTGFESFLKGLVEVFKVFGIGVMTVLAPIKLLGEIIGATAAAISFAIEGDFENAKRALLDSTPADNFKADIMRIEEAIDGLGSSFEDTGTQAKEAAPKLIENKKAIEDTGKAAELAAQKAELDAKAKDKQAEAAAKAAAEAAKLTVELEKIASNERIKNIELAIGFNTDKLKEETEVIKSLIDSVTKTVETTGSSISSLAGDFTSLSALDLKGKRLLEDLIKDQSNRQQEALDLQKKLTTAQIDLVTERTKALRSGDALIKISGDGLAPELEAFMWKILETIQIRAAEDQAQFLLGA